MLFVLLVGLGCEEPFEPPTTRGAIVYGMVTTQSDEPVADAVLRVQLDPLGCPATESQFGFVYPVEAKTNADGFYRAEPTLQIDIESTCAWIQVVSPVGESHSRGPINVLTVSGQLDSLEANIRLGSTGRDNALTASSRQ